jgi:hypothetical protein
MKSFRNRSVKGKTKITPTGHIVLLDKMAVSSRLMLVAFMQMVE